MARILLTQELQLIVLLSDSRWEDRKSTAVAFFYFSWRDLSGKAWFGLSLADVFAATLAKKTRPNS